MFARCIVLLAMACVWAPVYADIHIGIDDGSCSNGTTTIDTLTSHVCCPGVEKHHNTHTYCCIDGNDDDDDSDLSSCKDTVNANDGDYDNEVENVTGWSPPHPDDGSSANMITPAFAIISLAASSAFWNSI